MSVVFEHAVKLLFHLLENACIPVFIRLGLAVSGVCLVTT